MYTYAEMKRMNEAAGERWFSKESMAFFNTKFVGGTNRHNLFITSEEGPARDTSLDTVAYTVHIFVPHSGKVLDVGPFHQLTQEQARTLRKRVSEALDQIANRERDVMDRLTRVKAQGDLLTFAAGDKHFIVRLDDACDPARRIIG